MKTPAQGIILGGTEISMVYAARCHCGALEARYQTAVAPSAWSIRACQCSFCRAHGALSTSDPHGRLEFKARDESAVRRYQFGGRSADFLLCGACGVYLGARFETPTGRFGILNTRALQPISADLKAPEPMNYDGEPPAERSARRAARWTPLASQSL